MRSENATMIMLILFLIFLGLQFEEGFFLLLAALLAFAGVLLNLENNGPNN